MLEEVTILQKFRDKLIRKSWSESPQQYGWNEDYSLEWVDEVFPTNIAKHLDARDIECDYGTDSDDEDGLECDKDDFD